MHASEVWSWSSATPECSNLSMTGWMTVVLYGLKLINHKGEIENDRQSSRLVQKLRDRQSFYIHFSLLDSLVKKRPAAAKAEN